MLRVCLGFGNGGWAGEVPFTAGWSPPNGGGFVGESPQNDLNSGLGIIVICPGLFFGEDDV